MNNMARRKKDMYDAFVNKELGQGLLYIVECKVGKSNVSHRTIGPFKW